MDIPAAYRAGHAAARRIDPVLADRYVAHTTVGDPAADAVVAAITAHGRDPGWIARGIDGGPDAVADAPEAVRAFFAECEIVPDWFEEARTRAGCRAFHRNSEMFVGAFVGAVLVEGFATLISKSFSITGRLVDQGVRRLKQNNRQLVEIFLPGGLDRHGEGWKLSVRIRLVHARVRQLLAASPDWDADAWGVPISAAHMGFATAVFSGLLLERARMLGVELTAEERDSFMLVWRYAGHLMGVPPALSCAGQAEALHLHRIGVACEPPPDIESIILANGLVNSAPIVAGIADPAARRRLVRRIYGISRALIGDELADQLHFGPTRLADSLALIRFRNRADRLVARLVPGFERRRRADQFRKMLDLSFYSRSGIGYALPRHVYAERDVPDEK